MFDKSCFNWCGDDDCNKCAARGCIYSCPDPCPDYEWFFPRTGKEVSRDAVDD